MKLNSVHGGNIEEAAREFGLPRSEIIDFSASINPLGYPTQIPEIIQSNIDRILHYPDSTALALREKLGERFSLDPQTILAGNGSTELIYLLPRALKPKSAGLIVPAYSDYERALSQVKTAITFIYTKEADDFALNTLEFAPETEMVFLGNPNNPTGRLLEKDFLLEVIHNNPTAIFVIDEAFIDFFPRPEEYSLVKEATELPNLVVLRSMTKFFALPGLRLGYLVSCPEIVKSLQEYQEPWTVNALAQAVGEHVIFDDEYIRQSRDFISTEKEFLYQELAQIESFYPFKPAANFILVRIAKCGTRNADCGTRIADCGLRNADCGTRNADCGLRNADCGMRNADCGTRIADCGLRNADCELQNKKSEIRNPKSEIQWADQLKKLLIKEGFLIRDCFNFRGLDGRFFRLAVRTREENTAIVGTFHNCQSRCFLGLS